MEVTEEKKQSEAEQAAPLIRQETSEVKFEYPERWPTTPVQVTCKDCRKTGMTNIHQRRGTLCWILFVVCLLIPVFWLGCCIVPFYIPACNDQDHRCSHCYHVIGVRRSM